MTSTLSNKIAIVTGGSRGIGAQIAREFAKRGAKIAITYVSNEKAANSVVDDIRNAGGSAIAIQADSRDMASPEKIVQTTMKSFNSDGIDILVNNAASGKMLDFMQTDLEIYNDMFDINVRGPIFLVKAVLPVIRRGGRIINISSLASRDRMPAPFTLYSATKAAVEGLTRSWAFSYAGEKDITVNAILPGPVDTDILADSVPEVVEALKMKAPAKRLATVDDIAQIAGFLAEDGARWINGDCISATGGGIMI